MLGFPLSFFCFEREAQGTLELTLSPYFPSGGIIVDAAIVNSQLKNKRCAYFYFMVRVFCQNARVCTKCVSAESKEGIGCPGTRVVNGCEPACGSGN